ncbi:C-type lectin domain family 4 member C isoform X1 [Microcebus murinus]|uniref:C-type lectin domain family 4 member C isoform X1 n=1 Tax=Microcebus murinus TaxID=30608 RepID=UPI003F6C68EE
MAPEGPPQDREKEVWWLQVKVWSVAVISISLLSACFVVSSVVTYSNSVYSKNKKLSKLQEYQQFYSSLTCVIGGKEVEDWSCCPTLWSSFQSSCYFISTVKQSWAEHWKNCSRMGADLAVISTEDEQDFITQNLNEESAYFMGLSDPEGQRHWQWVDRTPYNESATFWHSGEPNNPSERCVIVNFRHPSRQWGWNDIDCHETEKSICEMTKIYL